MNPAELYTQLATQAPKRETPVVEPEDNFVLPELDEAQQKELGDYIQQAYSMYEGLPPAQKFVAEVAPGTGEAISAYEAKKFFEETKDAIKEGKFGEAALKGGLTALAGLGTIPLAGKGIQVAKAAAKRLPDLLSAKNKIKILKENKRPVTDSNLEKLTDEIEETKEYLNPTFISKGQEPKNITKGYKIFHKENNKLYPLFVDTDTPIPINQWMKADKGYFFLDTKGVKRQPAGTGDKKPFKDINEVKKFIKGTKVTGKRSALINSVQVPYGTREQFSKMYDIPLERVREGKPPISKKEIQKQNLSPEEVQKIFTDSAKQTLLKNPFGERLSVKYRPGFHADTIPFAEHLAQPGTKGKGKNRVWVEVEFGNDKDYTDIVRERGINPKTGNFNPKNADIDYIPEGGSYRYKTSPTMEGAWLIGGEMKVNRVLDLKEVNQIRKDLKKRGTK